MTTYTKIIKETTVDFNGKKYPIEKYSEFDEAGLIDDNGWNFINSEDRAEYEKWDDETKNSLDDKISLS